MISEKEYLDQMYLLAAAIPCFDPLIDIGVFDHQAGTFHVPVEYLFVEATGQAYPKFIQEKILQIRKLYMEWQNELKTINYYKAVTQKIPREEREVFVESALKAGFHFKEIARLIGCSEITLRTKWNRGKTLFPHSRTVYLKKKMRLGILENENNFEGAISDGRNQSNSGRYIYVGVHKSA